MKFDELIRRAFVVFALLWLIYSLIKPEIAAWQYSELQQLRRVKQNVEKQITIMTQDEKTRNIFRSLGLDIPRLRNDSKSRQRPGQDKNN